MKTAQARSCVTMTSLIKDGDWRWSQSNSMRPSAQCVTIEIYQNVDPVGVYRESKLCIVQEKISFNPCPYLSLSLYLSVFLAPCVG